jgi:hypothetical protein
MINIDLCFIDFAKPRVSSSTRRLGGEMMFCFIVYVAYVVCMC